MKNIGIKNPCSENWNEMSKNEQGAFCQKCASQVYDFTKKSSLEIKQTLLSLVGQPVCGRITNVQEIELNEEFNHWMNRQNQQSFQSQLLFALLIVFGLGLFSCENPKDEKKITEIQTSVARIVKENSDSTTITVTNQTHANEIWVGGDYIQGDMKMEDPIIIDYVSEELISPQSEIYTIDGGMSYSRDYEIFLHQEIQQSTEEVDENGKIISKKFEAKVFPNPAKEQTTFEISIPEKGLFEISLYDMSGKMLQVIRNGELDKGKFRQELDLIDLVPGMYLVIINSGSFKETVRFNKI